MSFLRWHCTMLPCQLSRQSSRCSSSPLTVSSRLLWCSAGPRTSHSSQPTTLSLFRIPSRSCFLLMLMKDVEPLTAHSHLPLLQVMQVSWGDMDVGWRSCSRQDLPRLTQVRRAVGGCFPSNFVPVSLNILIESKLYFKMFRSHPTIPDLSFPPATFSVDRNFFNGCREFTNAVKAEVQLFGTYAFLFSPS